MATTERALETLALHAGHRPDKETLSRATTIKAREETKNG